MKIATITFHWANNYGAVLQAYALQQFLLKNNFETEIIDYLPYKKFKLFDLLRFVKLDFNYVKKEKVIEEFRKENLILSDKKYYNNDSLFQSNGRYSAVICGSDQVWNTSFIKFAEYNKNTLNYYFKHNKPKYTLSYFLNFVDEDTRRIAYAVSLGTENYPQYIIDKVKPELDKYYAIAVREKTAKKVLEGFGCDSKVVLDPTFLLDTEDYLKLLKNYTYEKEKVFSYILHDNQFIIEKTAKYTKNKFGEEYIQKKTKPNFGIYEWLYKIANSDFVVTNSFHGVVFSIIFRRDFVVATVQTSKMNDRIYTLLDSLDLRERIIEDYDENIIDDLMSKKIDFDAVGEKLEILKCFSKDFLLNSLKG